MVVKTNERPGTKATARYVRMSASKARVVLDLIRDKHVSEAAQILSFSDRLASEVIEMCLRSAIANAAHNEEIAEEELFVSACYADEGPTLKRFRPRARGRAGRIHKQTCHITVVVSRLNDDQLDLMREREERRSGQGKKSSDAGSRSRRVAKSRKADNAPEETAAEDDVADEVVADEATDTVVADQETTTEETAAEVTDAVVADQETSSEETVDEEVTTEEATADDTKEEEAE